MPQPWFKFYGLEFLGDPKILQLNGNERSCWLTILCLASQTDDGVVKLSTEYQLLALSGISDEMKVLEKLEKLGMVTNCDGNVTVINWAKRQVNSSTFRMRRLREKQKNGENVTGRLRIKNKIRKDIRKEIDQPELEKFMDSDRMSSQTYNDVYKIFEAFKPVNKHWHTLEENPKQYEAAMRMLGLHGLDPVLKVISILPKTNRMKFVSNITTPLKLEEKWQDLENQLYKKKSETEKSKIAFV